MAANERKYDGQALFTSYLCACHARLSLVLSSLMDSIASEYDRFMIVGEPGSKGPWQGTAPKGAGAEYVPGPSGPVSCHDPSGSGCMESASCGARAPTSAPASHPGLSP